MSRRTLLAFAGAVAAILLLAAALLGAAGPATAPATAGAGQPAEPVAVVALQGCASDPEPESCLQSRLALLQARWPAGAILDALELALGSRPELAASCHAPMHALGQSAYKSSRSLSDALAVTNPVCQGGYQHGVFDAWGETLTPGSPDLARLAQAAALCDHAPAGDARYLCFDGFGHVAWRTGSTMVRAAQACLHSLTREGRLGCMAGIVMDRYAPVTPSSSPEPLDGLPGQCRLLPAKLWEGSLAVRSACRQAAVYPFTQETAGLRMMDPTIRPQELGDRYAKRCAALQDSRDPEAAADVLDCTRQVGFGLWFAAGNDAATALSWCKLMPAGMVTACTAQVTRLAQQS